MFKTHGKYSSSVRFLSLTLLLIFFSETAFADAAKTFLPFPLDRSENSPQVSLRGDNADFFRPFLPEIDQASVSDSFRGTRGGIVIHIRDAHSQPQTQIQIAHLLDQLTRRNKIRTVAVEGAEGELNPKLFSTFPSKKIRREVGAYYLEQGRLTGSEYLAVTDRPDLELFGVENKKIYDENRKLYLEIVNSGENNAELTGALESIAQAAGRFVFSASLREYHKQRMQYASNPERISDYLAYLQGAAKSAGIDLRGYPDLAGLAAITERGKKMESADIQESLKGALAELEQIIKISSPRIDQKPETDPSKAIRLFTAQLEKLPAESAEVLRRKYPEVFSYLDYLADAKKISPESFVEMERLEKRLREKMAVTDKEKFVDGLIMKIDVLKRMLALAMSKEDVEFYYEHRDEFETSRIVAALQHLLAPYHYEINLPDITPLDVHRQKIEKFYAAALRRDEVLISNALKRMNSTGQKIIILITGGFHSPGIEAYLRREGYSFLVMTPRAKSSKPMAESKLYLDAMRGNPLAFETYLSSISRSVSTSDAEFQLTPPLLIPEMRHGVFALQRDDKTLAASFWDWMYYRFVFEKKNPEEVFREVMASLPRVRSERERNFLIRYVHAVAQIGYEEELQGNAGLRQRIYFRRPDGFGVLERSTQRKSRKTSAGYRSAGKHSVMTFAHSQYDLTEGVPDFKIPERILRDLDAVLPKDLSRSELRSDSSKKSVPKVEPLGGRVLPTANAVDLLLAQSEPAEHTETIPVPDEIAKDRFAEVIRSENKAGPDLPVTVIERTIVITKDALGRINAMTEEYPSPGQEDISVREITEYRYDKENRIESSTFTRQERTFSRGLTHLIVTHEEELFYQYASDGRVISLSGHRTTPGGRETLMGKYEYAEGSATPFELTVLSGPGFKIQDAVITRFEALTLEPGKMMEKIYRPRLIHGDPVSARTLIELKADPDEIRTVQPPDLGNFVLRVTESEILNTFDAEGRVVSILRINYKITAHAVENTLPSQPSSGGGGSSSISFSKFPVPPAAAKSQGVPAAPVRKSGTVSKPAPGFKMRKGNSKTRTKISGANRGMPPGFQIPQDDELLLEDTPETFEDFAARRNKLKFNPEIDERTAALPERAPNLKLKLVDTEAENSDTDWTVEDLDHRDEAETQSGLFSKNVMYSSLLLAGILSWRAAGRYMDKRMPGVIRGRKYAFPLYLLLKIGNSAVIFFLSALFILHSGWGNKELAQARLHTAYAFMSTGLPEEMNPAQRLSEISRGFPEDIQKDPLLKMAREQAKIRLSRLEKQRVLSGFENLTTKKSVASLGEYWNSLGERWRSDADVLSARDETLRRLYREEIAAQGLTGETLGSMIEQANIRLIKDLTRRIEALHKSKLEVSEKLLLLRTHRKTLLSLSADFPAGSETAAEIKKLRREFRVALSVMRKQNEKNEYPARSEMRSAASFSEKFKKGLDEIAESLRTFHDSLQTFEANKQWGQVMEVVEAYEQKLAELFKYYLNEIDLAEKRSSDETILQLISILKQYEKSKAEVRAILDTVLEAHPLIFDEDHIIDPEIEKRIQLIEHQSDTNWILVSRRIAEIQGRHHKRKYREEARGLREPAPPEIKVVRPSRFNILKGLLIIAVTAAFLSFAAGFAHGQAASDGEKTRDRAAAKAAAVPGQSLELQAPGKPFFSPVNYYRDSSGEEGMAISVPGIVTVQFSQRIQEELKKQKNITPLNNAEEISTKYRIPVIEGEPIAYITDEELEKKIKENEEEFDVAARNYGRITGVYSKLMTKKQIEELRAWHAAFGPNHQRQLDDARHDDPSAEVPFEIEFVKHALRRAELLQIKRAISTVVAPADGFLIVRTLHSGEKIQGSIARLIPSTHFSTQFQVASENMTGQFKVEIQDAEGNSRIPQIYRITERDNLSGGRPIKIVTLDMVLPEALPSGIPSKVKVEILPAAEAPAFPYSKGIRILASAHGSIKPRELVPVTTSSLYGRWNPRSVAPVYANGYEVQLSGPEMFEDVLKELELHERRFLYYARLATPKSLAEARRLYISVVPQLNESLIDKIKEVTSKIKGIRQNLSLSESKSKSPGLMLPDPAKKNQPALPGTAVGSLVKPFTVMTDANIPEGVPVIHGKTPVIIQYGGREFVELYTGDVQHALPNERGRSMSGFVKLTDFDIRGTGSFILPVNAQDVRILIPAPEEYPKLEREIQKEQTSPAGGTPILRISEESEIPAVVQTWYRRLAQKGEPDNDIDQLADLIAEESDRNNRIAAAEYFIKYYSGREEFEPVVERMILQPIRTERPHEFHKDLAQLGLAYFFDHGELRKLRSLFDKAKTDSIHPYIAWQSYQMIRELLSSRPDVLTALILEGRNPAKASLRAADEDFFLSLIHFYADTLPGNPGKITPMLRGDDVNDQAVLAVLKSGFWTDQEILQLALQMPEKSRNILIAFAESNLARRKSENFTLDLIIDLFKKQLKRIAYHTSDRIRLMEWNNQQDLLALNGPGWMDWRTYVDPDLASEVGRDMGKRLARARASSNPPQIHLYDLSPVEMQTPEDPYFDSLTPAEQESQIKEFLKSNIVRGVRLLFNPSHRASYGRQIFEGAKLSPSGRYNLSLAYLGLNGPDAEEFIKVIEKSDFETLLIKDMQDIRAGKNLRSLELSKLAAFEKVIIQMHQRDGDAAHIALLARALASEAELSALVRSDKNDRNVRALGSRAGIASTQQAAKSETDARSWLDAIPFAMDYYSLRFFGSVFPGLSDTQYHDINQLVGDLRVHPVSVYDELESAYSSGRISHRDMQYLAEVHGMLKNRMLKNAHEKVTTKELFLSFLGWLAIPAGLMIFYHFAFTRIPIWVKSHLERTRPASDESIAREAKALIESEGLNRSELRAQDAITNTDLPQTFLEALQLLRKKNLKRGDFNELMNWVEKAVLDRKLVFSLDKFKNPKTWDVETRIQLINTLSEIIKLSMQKANVAMAKHAAAMTADDDPGRKSFHAFAVAELQNDKKTLRSAGDTMEEYRNFLSALSTLKYINSYQMTRLDYDLRRWSNWGPSLVNRTGILLYVFVRIPLLLTLFNYLGKKWAIQRFESYIQLASARHPDLYDKDIAKKARDAIDEAFIYRARPGGGRVFSAMRIGGGSAAAR